MKTYTRKQVPPGTPVVSWGTFCGRNMVTRQIALAKGFDFLFFSEQDLLLNAQIGARTSQHENETNEEFIAAYIAAYRAAVQEYREREAEKQAFIASCLA